MLLTVDEARAFITTRLSDDALRALLDAAEQAIDTKVGPLVDDLPAPRTEKHLVSGPLIMLRNPAASITSVTLSDDTVLDPTDYRLRPGGRILERLDTGPNPATSWWTEVTVVLVPVSDMAERVRVQVALVKNDIAFNPGIASQSIGPWSESYGSAGAHAASRADILASLEPGGYFDGIR